MDFDNRVTLIVGKNGAGKTAILDAVAVSVSTLLLGIDGCARKLTDISKEAQNRIMTGEKPLLLKTVETAICKCFERISGYKNTGIIFDLDTHRLVLEFETVNGSLQKFAMDEMSDGYKNTLSMIGDIAYRMAVLNPMLGEKVFEETPGVILIDEIDLHLHPQWQQTIISDLNAIFPNIQFIVSSHAPEVINSVAKEQIRILDNGKIYMPAAQTYGRDANSILREVMNVSERPADNPGVVRIEYCRPRNPQNEADYDKKAALDFKWMLGVCYGNSLMKGVKPEY